MTQETTTTSTERAIGRVEGKLDGVLTLISNTQSEVRGLRDDFGTMEKGRLSKLEVMFATLETTVSVKARNSAIWMAAGISILTSVSAAIVIYLLIGK